MQNIINNLDDWNKKTLIAELVAFNDKTVDEYNEACEIVENNQAYIAEIESKNTDCMAALAKQHEALIMLKKNKDTLLNRTTIAQNKCDSLEHQLSVLRKESKAQREQIKRNKAAIKQRDAKLSKLEKFKGKKEDTVKPMKTVYLRDTHVLQVYPSRIEGKFGDQVVLLYSPMNGCYVTCYLDENNELSHSSFINDDSKASERTIALINNNTMQIPDDVKEFAAVWLYRVNVKQKRTLMTSDLQLTKI